MPDGCEADADKGYQGLADEVTLVTVYNVATGEEQQVPRVIIKTPFKKPKGQELTDEQKTFNRQLGALRVRVGCILALLTNLPARRPPLAVVVDLADAPAMDSDGPIAPSEPPELSSGTG